MASINLNSTENDNHESSSEIILDDKSNSARHEDKWIDVNLNDPQDKRKYEIAKQSLSEYLAPPNQNNNLIFSH